MQQCNFPRKLLAIHILGLSGLLAMPAQATIITNSLTATATAKAGTNAATVEGPQTDASYVSQYAFTDQSTKYLTHALRRNDEARRTISFS